MILMQSLETFKDDMNWTMMELEEYEIEELYESVDTETYATFEDIEEDFNYDDNLLSFDVNLHSVVENFSELFKRGRERWITFYYLKADEMYVGVMTYDY